MNDENCGQNCPHFLEIHDLTTQSNRLEKFINEVEPLLDYVKAEKIKNESRAALYEKISATVMGGAIMSFFGAIGYWAFEKIKTDLGIK